jgi:ethanolamine utilization protein EutQ
VSGRQESRVPSQVPRPIVLVPDDVPWEPLDVGCTAEVRTVLGPDRSRALGAGLTRLVDCEFEWRLGYDEVLYVLDGAIEVDHPDGTARAARGQILFVPKGCDVTYRAAGSTTAFYATYPVDWEAHAGG